MQSERQEFLIVQFPRQEFAIQVDYIWQKDPITDVQLDSKCTPDCTCCKCGVQEVCNRSLVHKEVAEARSDYRKSYFLSCRNIACGDSTWSNQIEKDRVRVLAG